MTAAKEFAAFWLENSVHADEQFRAKRGRPAVQELADKLVHAAEGQGLTKQQIEAELGDIGDYIRASIDAQNSDETTRLGKER